jgi:hypothetical protein
MKPTDGVWSDRVGAGQKAKGNQAKSDETITDEPRADPLRETFKALKTRIGPLIFNQQILGLPLVGAARPSV